MLLEKLRDYARDQLGSALPPPGYQQQAIRYVISLDRDGRYLGFTDSAGKENPRGETRLAPHAKRSSGVAPKLLADTGEYVLGIARKDPNKPANPERVAQQHSMFRDVVERCATATKDPLVEAVAGFLRERPVTTLEQDATFDPTATITFRIDGIFPIDREEVRRFWASSRNPDDGDADTAGQIECIVCGTVGPVLERHPLKIKGIPGGHSSGTDLISANVGAFLSYGLRASQIAPTCPTCAEAYGNALNALLASKSTSLRAGGLAYAFWTDPNPAVDWAPVPLFSDPKAHENEVKALLEAHWAGTRSATAIDDTRFYAAAFGASEARAVVKDWIDTTVGVAKRQMGRYFALQEMVEWDGSPGSPLPLLTISGSTVRRKKTPPDIVTQSLIRLALRGNPLPMDLAYLAVRRNRAEQNVTRGRAMLIKMVLGSRAGSEVVMEDSLTGLNQSNPSPAYLCGRLLAKLEQIQWRALGDVNASVVDKFYGTASSSPATAFSILLKGVRGHLSKIGKTNKGAEVNLDRQIEEIMYPLNRDFPATLDLRDQAVFALGFYHQRAADRLAARERKNTSDSGPGDEPIATGA